MAKSAVTQLQIYKGIDVMKELSYLLAIGDLPKIQMALKEAMRVLSTVLHREKVTFWLGFGALLGAVRDHDLIPWDDDIDLVVLSEDFERLTRIVERDLSDYFIVLNQSKDIPLGIPMKLVLKDTAVTERDILNELGIDTINFIGLSIDIFPVFPAERSMGALAPFASFAHKLWIRKQFASFIPRHRFHSFSIKKKLQFRIISLIPRFVLQQFVALIEDNLKSESSEFFRFSLKSVSYKEIMHRSEIFPISRGLVGDLFYPIPNNPTGHLERVYGPKFMIWPVESQRKNHLQSGYILPTSYFWQFFVE